MNVSQPGQWQGDYELRLRGARRPRSVRENSGEAHGVV